MAYIRETAKKRLSKDERGRALLDLIHDCGGRSAFMRASGCTAQNYSNIVLRGYVSQPLALQIAEREFFKSRGWTKERIRPDLNEYEWRMPAAEE